ncbi:F0F1 ATP synthase subunit alpha [candidate division WWE3 bacterium CG10_big_fil_rev_8_21_14_0_10_32_10]|uniref:ATP synthase subunit alpha n=1 Tax=candidate division WWE3 bacterium CG10_big_fil_rev_8_21_14_0_10_32_10 TaxID=1975090 RepID=A0A2H0RAE4_UNCKA|nr:MAG: F0F1 ATP synthase subunit alpha [candidate division WWE3 bacterium CG10_big_fil_rev_8_21_14_0_10_32_10]
MSKTTELKNFIKNLEKSIEENVDITRKKENVGVIKTYKDGVIEIEGLKDLRMSQLIEIENIGVKALIMNLKKNSAKALVLKDSDKIKEGLFVSSAERLLSLKVGNSIVGRVVNSLGEPIDDKEALKTDKAMPHEKIALGVFAREPVKKPLQTGIIAIDSLVPVGRGQRELIIGDRQTGKTALAVDTILNQKNEDVICIYCAIGQRESSVSRVYETLQTKGAMNYSIIVSAPAASSAMMQFLVPYAASGIAEYFLEQGKDVLVIYDDLSKHAVSYREISLLLRRPPGREAYPGDVFYIHSRLLERAVKLNKENGGGSITALPIIETQASDVSAYIPTNVISITDGQIFLESDLFNKGIIPAINVGLSVSRVGSSAQTKIIKKIAGTLKLDLATYYELESFSQFATELDKETQKTLTRGKKIVLSLTQKQNTPYALWEQVVIIWAVTKGYFDNISDTDIRSTITNMLTDVKTNNKKLIESITQEKDLTEDIEEGLNSFMKGFFK